MRPATVCLAWLGVSVAAEDSSEWPAAGFQHDPSGASVSAGHFHTCALRSTPSVEFGGIAHCWGQDAFGQVSRAPTTRFVQLSSGHFHTCGVTLGEAVVCWGESREAVSQAGLFQQVSAGQFHSCALTKDGEARCWGQDMQTGATAAPGGKFVQLSAGTDWTCGLRPSGLTECWGSDQRGQASPPAGTRFAQIAASTSGYHTCGLTLDAEDLVCWGENRKGEAPALKTGPFRQLAVGFRLTCLITSRGDHVECLGLSARLFDDSIYGDRRWEQVTAGRDHICALDVDGELFCNGQPISTAAKVPAGFIVA